MENIVRVGVDLAKQVIQVHAVGGSGHAVARHALTRSKFMEWCVQLRHEQLLSTFN
jgi:hypothetical protein